MPVARSEVCPECFDIGELPPVPPLCLECFVDPPAVPCVDTQCDLELPRPPTVPCLDTQCELPPIPPLCLECFVDPPPVPCLDTQCDITLPPVGPLPPVPCLDTQCDITLPPVGPLPPVPCLHTQCDITLPPVGPLPPVPCLDTQCVLPPIPPLCLECFVDPPPLPCLDTPCELPPGPSLPSVPPVPVPAPGLPALPERKLVGYLPPDMPIPADAEGLTEDDEDGSILPSLPPISGVEAISRYYSSEPPDATEFSGRPFASARNNFQLVLRRGWWNGVTGSKKGFGDRKIQQKHLFTTKQDDMLQDVAAHGRRVDQQKRVLYVLRIALVENNLPRDYAEIRMVTNQQPRPADARWSDGFPFGIITAYCTENGSRDPNNLAHCPEWIYSAEYEPYGS